MAASGGGGVLSRWLPGTCPHLSMPVFSSKPSVLNTACYCRRTPRAPGRSQRMGYAATTKRSGQTRNDDDFIDKSCIHQILKHEAMYSWSTDSTPKSRCAPVSALARQRAALRAALFVRRRGAAAGRRLRAGLRSPGRQGAQRQVRPSRGVVDLTLFARRRRHSAVR